ncbi:MAG: hypothetical protein NZ888_04450 [Candidatus Nitrosocaldus sp.]|nr:hypothetical protein [Candidatus Nitrosocaldus sp.]MDW8000779.1 hypothetical protein [Candidatus Nitrosocaldus sp.]
MEGSIKEIYEYLSREASNGSLQELDPMVYRRIAEMLNALKGYGYEGIDAKIRDSLMAMLSDIARLMLSIRLEKLKDSGSIDYSKLTGEELYVALAERELRLRQSLLLSSILNGRSKVLEAMAERAASTLVPVRFIKQVDAFTGRDDARYGPFEAEDIAMVPFQDAVELVRKGVAIELPLVEY